MFERSKRATDSRGARTSARKPWTVVGLGAVVVVAALLGLRSWQESRVASESVASERTRTGGATFTGSRQETERFLAYHRAIVLSPEQEVTKEGALASLPAPCCSQFTAATCCCDCNLARSTWGLAKHLVADLGLDSASVRARAAEWHRVINPNGFSGDACFTGGCARRFDENGCGGMREGKLVF